MEKNNINNDNLELEKINTEPVFNIHRMPKGYKTGRFEFEKTKTEINESGPSRSSQFGNKKQNKKIGFFIIIFGILLVFFLGYLVFSYISTPDFSLNKAFSFLEKKEKAINDSSILPNIQDQIVDVVEEDAFEDVEIEEDIIIEEEQVGEEDVFEDIISEPIYIYVDSDNDGLSDDEEFILGTNYLNPDTDGDGYDDLAELLNLYNPSGPGRLIDNINISEYQNNFFNYSILFPNQWEKSSLSDESSVIFSINNNSFIQVLVEKNDNNLNIKNWYAGRFFTSVDDSRLVSNNKWDGVYSEDRLVLYLTDKNLQNVYTILYSVPSGQPHSYVNIFKMMINSFNLR